MTVHAGVWNFSGEPINRESLSQMAKCVTECGPDGEATYLKGGFGVLYRPLHSTSESRLERQPHIFASGDVLVFDGRIDNRTGLIDELSGAMNEDCSDVALVAAAFARWDTGCFARLIGDWALVIWQRQARRLLLARDYIGVKPLFYSCKSNQVLWCSHLAPMALRGEHHTVCDEYIAGYLTGYPKAHLTPYQEILSVPPGGFVRVNERGWISEPYWRFDPALKARYKTDIEYEEHFLQLFRQSIRRRLRADAPVLAGLSGGLDSSAIVCMADDVLRREGTGSRSLDTFSFCDRSEPEEDDFIYFTKVEEQRGRVGHHAELSAAGDSFSFDPPNFKPVPGFGERHELTEAFSQVLTQGKYRVVLSGLGGDELLGQAFDPRIQLSESLLDFRLGESARLLKKWSLALRQPCWNLLFGTVGLFLPASIRTAGSVGASTVPWINRRFVREHRFAHPTQAGEGTWWWSPRTRDSYQTYAILARQLTYLFPGVSETRYPYLDRQLVEFLLSIPTTQLAQPSHTRCLMRRSLRDLLPPEVLSRKTKASAGRCAVLTVRKHWDRISEVLRSSLGHRLRYIDSPGLLLALAQARNGQLPLYVVSLFKALSLEFWLRDAEEREVISISPAVQTTPTRTVKALANRDSGSLTSHRIGSV